MTILKLWQSNKEIFEEKKVDQILSFCGDGNLLDGKTTSIEFRQILGYIPSRLLQKYAEECLTEPFKHSGLVLQDIINQIGIRLGYKVDHGLYKGKKNNIGFDGIWTSTDGHQIIVECKTTDAYRINLDTIVNYRTKLIEENRLNKTESSILIIVGREDTGDLEAQIRGSRHAWDIRLISTDALLKLMALKESLNDTKTFQQINQMLKPMEYTKVDPLIDVIFYTTEDLQLEQSISDENNEEDSVQLVEGTSSKINTISSIRATFHELCINKISKNSELTLLRQGRCLYTTPNRKHHLVCIISKKYFLKDQIRYWYAFHPSQQEFLKESELPFVAFGCGSEDKLLLIPYSDFFPLLEHCNISEKGGRMYWHVEIFEKNNEFTIRQSHLKNVNVTKYLI